MLPISIANEMGLKTAIFTSRTRVSLQKKEQINGINVFRFDSPFTMLGQLIRSQPALVHGHSFGWIPANVAPAIVKKCVLTPHIYKLSEYPKWKINLATRFSKRADSIIALTQFEAAQFNAVMPQTKVNIIPHPIDSDYFSPGTMEDIPKRPIQEIKSSNKVVLCVSNLFPVKNMETLIKGFSIVKQKIPNVKLLIVGGEPESKLGVLTSKKANWHYQLKLMGLVRALDLKNDVIFTGHKGAKELRDLYRIADVFCLPSTMECQSLAAGEAASSKLPLVLSNLEPLREIYEGCALFQNALDYRSLSDNIVTVLEDPKLAENLGKNGRTKMSEYHPIKIRKKLKHVYNSLLSN